MGRLTQNEIAAFMASEANAAPLHQFGAPGHRVAAASYTQGAAAFSAPPIDFHLLELHETGQHRGKADYEREDDGRDFCTRVGMLNYVQPGQGPIYDFEGGANVIQLWIDCAAFDDVAGNLAKGDPENTETLGFVGVFDPLLSQSVKTIWNEVKNPSAAGQLMIDAAAQQIAVAILRRNLNRAPSPNLPRSLSARELHGALDFIEDHLAENKGLEALARSVGMSMYAFAHAFKESVGVAPHQFLIQRRVARAKEMLAHTNEPIAEIAYASGFSSQAHLTNIFGKHVGVSPLKYRKGVRA